jgi:LacI family transcriptional regulator
VVAANDLLAIGAIRAGVFQPSLTSVSLGSAERGRAAAQLVLDRVGDVVEPAQQIAIGPQLFARESTALPTELPASKEKSAR